MVATVVRLRLTLLRRTLARERWRLVVLVLGGVWALGTLPSLLAGAFWLAGPGSGVRPDVLVVGGTLLVLGWIVVPVLVFGMDDTLDASRFATFAVPVGRLVPGLLVAAVISVPAVFTALVCALPVLAWAGEGGGAVLVAALATPVALGTCLLAARISTTVAGRVLGTRRAREVTAVLTTLGLALVVPVAVAIGSLGLDGTLERVPGVAQALGWTPLGLVWAAPASAAEGDVVGAVARLALAVGWLAAAVAGWGALLRWTLVRPGTRGGGPRRRADAMLAGSRLRAGTPEQRASRAVAARARRYWTGDPRYLSALVSVLLLPAVIVLLLGAVLPDARVAALVVGPLLAAGIGWGRHDDTAYDGTAYWLHLSARVRGEDDRRGRTAAVLGWSLPAVVAVSVAGALVAGRPDQVATVVGAACGLLASGLAVSAVTSALLVYPVPAPGASPFAAGTGSIGISMGAQLVASAATFLVSVPVLVCAGFALAGWSSGPAATAVVGMLGGALALAVGVRVGGRVLDARGARILAGLVAAA